MNSEEKRIQGYYLFLNHNENIALAKAILEYNQNHPIHEETSSEIVRTLILLDQIIEKMHEE